MADTARCGMVAQICGLSRFSFGVERGPLVGRVLAAIVEGAGPSTGGGEAGRHRERRTSHRAERTTVVK